MTRHAAGRSMVYFCVVDGAAYVPKAITALRSIQRFNAAASYAVLGALDDDDPALGMIADHGLDHVHLDLSSVFADCRSFRAHRLARPFPPRPWPSETYWWFGAPEPLAARGHTHSCAVDGDVFGVGPVDLDEVFDGRSPAAGVAKRDGRVNSGVLFLDHVRALDVDLFGTAREAYDTRKRCDHDVCTGFCLAASDQGLLAALEESDDLEVRRIDNAYNHMLLWDEREYLAKNQRAPLPVDESRILHLLSKPWTRLPRRGRLNPLTADAHQRWWDFVGEIWPDEDERERHFGRPRRFGRRVRATR